MNRRGFVLGAGGLLIPRAADAAFIGNRRALIPSSLPSVVDFTSVPASSTVSPVATSTWPLGVPKDGDLLLGIATGAASGSPSVVAPAGYNTLYSGTGGTGSSDYSTAYLGWKLAKGEGTTETWSLSAGTARMCVALLRISRAAPGVAPLFNHSYGTASGYAPAIIPAQPSLIVCAFTATAGVTGITTTTTGYTTAGMIHLSTNDYAAMFCWTKSTNQAASGTTTGTLFAIQAYYIVIPAIA